MLNDSIRFNKYIKIILILKMKLLMFVFNVITELQPLA